VCVHPVGVDVPLKGLSEKSILGILLYLWHVVSTQNPYQMVLEFYPYPDCSRVSSLSPHVLSIFVPPQMGEIAALLLHSYCWIKKSPLLLVTLGYLFILRRSCWSPILVQTLCRCTFAVQPCKGRWDFNGMWSAASLVVTAQILRGKYCYDH
jgi:hypothetical protein